MGQQYAHGVIGHTGDRGAQVLVLAERIIHAGNPDAPLGSRQRGALVPQHVPPGLTQELGRRPRAALHEVVVAQDGVLPPRGLDAGEERQVPGETTRRLG
ncbi:MAG: hypothetical protein PVH68_21475, partial [Armatimonadota bacterium]